MEVASKTLLTAAFIAASVTACASESSTDTQSLVTRAAESATQPPAPDVAPTTVPDAEPTLGRAWGPSQKGYGDVRPVLVYNGGSPSGMVYDIVWRSWGDEQAIGDGTAINTASGTIVTADAPPDAATIVAFDLGDCDGLWMYRSVVWFFPGDGETFEAHDHPEFGMCEEN